jgi:hypothetical protein
MKTLRTLLALSLALVVAPALASNIGGGGGGTVPGSTCGDATHAIGWNGSAYTCQAITGSATPGGASGQLQYNNAGALGGFTLSGDCTLAQPNITCTKSNGVALTSAAITAIGTSGAAIPLLNANNTWSGIQSLNAGDLVVNGATSGALAINCATVCGANTITFPAGTTNFSATGGASQVVEQTSAGGAFTVARLSCGDLSNAASGCSGTLPTSASPSATIGLSTVNGTASTYMTSDSAPALSQAISPTWTGAHTFAPTPVVAPSAVAEQFVPSVSAGASNAAGASTTFKASQGTGSGIGGTLVFQVAPPGSSGTSQNAEATAVTVATTTNSAFSSCCAGTSIEWDFANGLELFPGTQGGSGAFGFATGTTLDAMITNSGYWVPSNIKICISALCGGASMLISATAPTILSGFGTAPSIATSNGTASFTVNVGTGGTATSGVIGLPTATNGWNCYATDITTQSSTVFVTKETASSTTSCTIGDFNTSGAAAAWAAGDIVAVSAFAR